MVVKTCSKGGDIVLGKLVYKVETIASSKIGTVINQKNTKYGSFWVVQWEDKTFDDVRNIYPKSWFVGKGAGVYQR